MPESSESMISRFFAAGMEVLAEDGYGGLKLADLCLRVRVTSGSFYHHFDSWQDFTYQLVENWREERTRRLVELARAEVDPAERVELLLRFGVSLPHSAEAAIRVWSGVDPFVAEVQESVDRERLDITIQALEALTDDPDEASDLALSAFYLLVGFEQATGDRDVRELERFLRMLQDRALTVAGAEDLMSQAHDPQSGSRP
ncbi:MAG: TetR/AcrR family transcriptional regulator [Aeromicrobium sp.]